MKLTPLQRYISLTAIVCMMVIGANAQGIWAIPSNRIISSDTITVNDTVKVIMLVSDTSHHFTESWDFKSCSEANCKGEHSQLISHYYINKIDVGIMTSKPYIMFGYIVYDFFTATYLDDRKQLLNSNIIVWQTKTLK